MHSEHPEGSLVLKPSDETFFKIKLTDVIILRSKKNNWSTSGHVYEIQTGVKDKIVIKLRNNDGFEQNVRKDDNIDNFFLTPKFDKSSFHR